MVAEGRHAEGIIATASAATAEEPEKSRVVCAREKVKSETEMFYFLSCFH